jgi:hypothetical protein
MCTAAQCRTTKESAAVAVTVMDVYVKTMGYPYDSEKFLRNVGSHKSHTASHTRQNMEFLKHCYKPSTNVFQRLTFLAPEAFHKLIWTTKFIFHLWKERV